jgi:CRP-like cAMP-binding protein
MVEPWGLVPLAYLAKLSSDKFTYGYAGSEDFTMYPLLPLKMAEPGEALGLSAVISGTPYELTAETAGPCQVNFIDRDALMRLLDRYGELGLHSVQALSREFQSAYRDIHELVLARSSAGKLARLLLSWSGGPERDSAGKEISNPLQHDS